MNYNRNRYTLKIAKIFERTQEKNTYIYTSIKKICERTKEL